MKPWALDSPKLLLLLLQLLLLLLLLLLVYYYYTACLLGLCWSSMSSRTRELGLP